MSTGQLQGHSTSLPHRTRAGGGGGGGGGAQPPKGPNLPPSAKDDKNSNPDWEDVNDFLKMPVMSVMKALGRPLPWYADHMTGEEGPLSSSSASTTGTNAPQVLQMQPERFLYHQFTAVLPLIQRHPICNRAMPQKETTFWMNSEAALSDATRIYLLHPVLLALTVMLQRGRIKCIPEAQLTKHSRADFAFYWKSENRKMHLFAVLELKRRGGIKRQEFKNAWIYSLATSKDQEEVRARMEDAADKDYHTLLDGGAIWLCKQLSKYSKKSRAVAAFDWETMLFMDFPEDPDQEIPSHGILASKHFTQAIWFEEDQEHTKSGMYFSNMLLGFLVHSFKKYVPRSDEILKDPKIPYQRPPPRPLARPRMPPPPPPPAHADSAAEGSGGSAPQPEAAPATAAIESRRKPPTRLGRLLMPLAVAQPNKPTTTPSVAATGKPRSSRGFELILGKKVQIVRRREMEPREHHS